MPASENQSVKVVGFPAFLLECLLIRVPGDYASESQSVKAFGFLGFFLS